MQKPVYIVIDLMTCKAWVHRSEREAWIEYEHRVSHVPKWHKPCIVLRGLFFDYTLIEDAEKSHPLLKVHD